MFKKPHIIDLIEKPILPEEISITFSLSVCFTLVNLSVLIQRHCLSLWSHSNLIHVCELHWGV